MTDISFKIKRILSALLILILLLSVSACAEKEKKQEKEESTVISDSRIVFNTYVNISLYEGGSEQLIDEAFELCDRYEKMFSRTLEGGDVYNLNKASADSEEAISDYELPAEVFELLSTALSFCDRSGGSLDISIAPVAKLWGFTGGEMKVPEYDDIINGLKLTDYRDIVLDYDKKTVSFKKPHMEIDLGAIAKGYIADRLKEYLCERGVKSGVLSLGGNILCIGEKRPGTGFNIGIQKPFSDYAETVSVIEISDLSVVSSGIYEKYFEDEEGNFYHHILNPSSGYPYDNGLVAVTIVGSCSADCDALSTAVFSLGLEKGMELIDSIDGYYAFFVTSDYDMIYSDGFKENLNVKE